MRGQGRGAGFEPVNFDKLPDAFRDAEGKWFTIHMLNVAFLVNTNLVKDVPKSWVDLTKPEYKNSVVYLDPRSTGQGQVVTFAATFANGGSMDSDVKPGIDYLGKAKNKSGKCRSAHRRHHALRPVPEGRDPDLDRLRERRSQGQVHRRHGRRHRRGDPEEASAAACDVISLVKNGAEPERRQAAG